MAKKKESNETITAAWITGVLGIVAVVIGATITYYLSRPEPTPTPPATSQASTMITQAVTPPTSPTITSSPEPSATPSPAPTTPAPTATSPATSAPTSLPTVPNSLEVHTLAPGTPKNGNLTVGATDEYVFTGTANVPVLFTVDATNSNLQYQLKALDPSRKEVSHSATSYNKNAWAYTPAVTGQHTLQVVGFGEAGAYSVWIDFVDNAAQINRQAVELSYGTPYEDKLGEGAYDEYVFTGTTNVPLLYTIDSPDSRFGYIATLFDPNKKQVDQTGTSYHESQRLYTPKVTGQYTLRVAGAREYGAYNVLVELIDNEAQAGRDAVELAYDQAYEDRLARDAYDEYLFTGTVNVPLLITIHPEGNGLSYAATLLDPHKNKTDLKTNSYDEAILPVTPKNTGSYTLRVTGTNGFGSYAASVGLVDNETQVGREAVELAVGQPYADRVAKEAYDEYLFTSVANVPFTVTVEASGNLGYSFKLLDPNEKPVDQSRSYHGRNQWSFTPAVAGAYTLQLIGTDNYGDYSIWLDSSPDQK